MKRILGSLLIIVATFSYLATKIESTPTATDNKTVAVDVEESPVESSKRKGEKSKAALSKPTDKKLAYPAYLTDRPEEIIDHSAMRISWNDMLRLPNYVAWTLTNERVNGKVKRLDDFQPDPDIKKGISPTWADYRGSGYDRGHMCPAADNKHTMQAQKECFYMTNMCPQTHTLNAGDWSQLEDLCRKWAKKYGTVYIASGPIVNNYPGNKKLNNERIGENAVLVPDAFFKVVMCRGEYGVKAIGFICPNGMQNLQPCDYAVSVDSVEAVTGINFFTHLPKREEQKAEALCSTSDWIGL